MSKCTGHKFILLPPSHYTMGQYRVGWSETIEIFEKFKKSKFSNNFETSSQYWFRNSFWNDSSTAHFIGIFWTFFLHTIYIQMYCNGGSKNTKIFQNSLNKFKIWIQRRGGGEKAGRWREEVEGRKGGGGREGSGPLLAAKTGSKSILVDSR